jgi:DNA-directed RNA polymerase alpha subunit
VGVLPVDAIFSPVTKVNYNVERTRVGQVTDFERLILEVWTDGTIKPVDAVREAAENLVNHFFLFSNLNKPVEAGIERSSLVVSPEIFQTPIDRLELSPRTLNCLKRAHITKVGEVLEMADEDLLKIRNFGDKSLTELREKLAERGIGAPQDSGSGLDDESSQEGGVAVAEEVAPVGGLSAQDIRDLLGAGDAPEVAASPTGDTEDLDTDDDPEDDLDADGDEEDEE